MLKLHRSHFYLLCYVVYSVAIIFHITYWITSSRRAASMSYLVICQAGGIPSVICQRYWICCCFNCCRNIFSEFFRSLKGSADPFNLYLSGSNLPGRLPSFPGSSEFAFVAD